MTENDLVSKIKSQMRKNSKQFKAFELLSDQEWHCREHEMTPKLGSRQPAGGGGIQGLERGNRSGRRGLVLEEKTEYCQVCNNMAKWDRWTGEIKEANAPANIPPKLVEIILELYAYTEVVEIRQRYAHELVIDHRFPMQRWGANEPTHSKSMSDDVIRQKFQLLKKDAAGNHNLLKSRSCERCIKTSKRGTPFGIKFWYQGGEDWPSQHQQGKDAEKGCIGCGWYDMEKWRNALNQKLTEFVENQEK
jgi:hypothetical protein